MSEAEVTVTYAVKPPQAGGRHLESRRKSILAYVMNTAARAVLKMIDGNITWNWDWRQWLRKFFWKGWCGAVASH